MSKRAALYIRVSSDEQAKHGLSLGEQRTDLLKYAENHGYAVVDIYADEGTTARKAIKQRKELQRLLADVGAGRIDVIVIKCLDRWSRNIADFYETQKFLDEHEVTWECTQEKYNTSTASGRLYMNIRMSIAQDESDRTSERIKYVFEGKRERKEVLGNRIPFGYKVVDKHAVPDEKKAPAVLFMFEHIVNGGSARALPVAIWKKFGIKITYSVVYNSLRHRGYIGELYGIPDYCPPIVPYDLFQSVQSLLSKHRKFTPSGRIYLFSGLLVCPSCGRLLAAGGGSKTANGNRRNYTYRCQFRNAHPGLDYCQFGRYVSEKKIEQFLLDNIQTLFANHIHDIEISQEQQKKNNPEERLKVVKERMLRLKDIYLDGMIEKEIYEKEYVTLKQKASELTVLIEKAPPTHSHWCEVIEAADFRSNYEALTRENKRRFWHSLISRITFEDTPESRGKGGTFVFHADFL
ncbi:MAG: recombinase family protein [Selenomonadaceae bacterium]|nr:recombinase family protein [Selenomonadaceae bacterium]MBP3722004.1 recombinase family protein [Selenomonadaceae bacterium]